MKMQTNDEIQLVVKEIVESVTSESPFFDSNPARRLPTFSQEEIHAGDVLGMGQFGIVQDLNKIQQERDHQSLSFLFRSEKMSITCEESESSIFDSKDNKNHSKLRDINEARTTMFRRCFRDGKSRFAVKRLRDDLQGEDLFNGALDLATEAKFLSCITHPNIVRLRAFVGNPGYPDFMLVLDRLYLTLQDQISKWKRETSRFPGFPKFKKRPIERSESFRDRIYAAYDIARAMRHLHENNVIHRDIKPENIAYDIRGDVKVYDLGLATEVKKKDMISPPEDYNLSGLTGSVRWMAPEVRLSLPYGPSADVYSFALVFWNIFSLQTPFGKVSLEKHFKKVIQSGERPSQLKSLPSSLQVMMTKCWGIDRSNRPTSQQICSTIKKEIEELENESLDRTIHLLDKSIHSNDGDIDT